MKKFYILLLFTLTSIVAEAQVANDSCHNAIAILMDEVVTFDNTLATTDTLFHPNNPCPSSGTDSLHNDIWYVHTATITGELLWNLCGFGTTFDSRIAVYNASASCPLSDSDLLACNEDGDATCTNAESQVKFDVVLGETYLMRLGGFGTDTMIFSGTGGFVLSEAPPTPDNDDCGSATALSLGSGQAINTLNATTDGPEHPNDAACFGFGDLGIQSDVWYTYTSEFTGTIKWTTCNTVSFDSRLAVYFPGTACPPMDADLMACNDDDSNCDAFTSTLFWDVEEGETYLMRIGGFNAEVGTGTFDLIAENIPDPPANDDCVNADSAYIISAEVADEFDVVFSGTTKDCLESDFPAPWCTNGQGTFKDVFYKFNTEGETAIEIRFFKSALELGFNVEFRDDCGNQFPFPDSLACFRADPDGPSTVIDTLRGLPATPTDVIMRVSDDIFSPQGLFDFQLVRFEATGTKEVDENIAFDVYPNPASEMLHVRIQEDISRDMMLSFYNSMGQKVLADIPSAALSPQQIVQVDITSLSSGIYYTKLYVDGNYKVLKWIKH